MSWHKFHAKRTETDGHSFASKLEAALYAQLKLEERAGLIRDIQVQDHVYLSDAEILYIPDFKYTVTATGKSEWAESKGMETASWRIKRKLWQTYGPGLLKVFKGSASRIILAEEIIGGGK
mgnify:FL=1